MKKLFTITLGLLLGLALLGCTDTTESTTAGLSYDNFFSITDYSQIFNRNEGTYIVYMYSTSCAHCENIKPTVLGFADTHADDIMIYFFDVTNGTEAAQTVFLNTVGLTTNTFGTPTLIVVVDNAFDITARSNFLYSGEIPITSILRDIDNGAYTYLK